MSNLFGSRFFVFYFFRLRRCRILHQCLQSVNSIVLSANTRQQRFKARPVAVWKSISELFLKLFESCPFGILNLVGRLAVGCIVRVIIASIHTCDTGKTVIAFCKCLYMLDQKIALYIDVTAFVFAQFTDPFCFE